MPAVGTPSPTPPGTAPVAPRPHLLLASAPRTRRWRALVQTRRRSVVGAVAIALVVTNAFIAHELVTAHATAGALRARTDELQVSVATRRAQLAALEAKVAAAIHELEARTSARDRLDADAAKSRAAAAATSGAVAATLRQAYAAHARIGPLKDCLWILHRAMNSLSTGDENAGSAALDTLNACDGDGR